MVHEPLFPEHAEDLLQLFAAEPLIVMERQLECRALHVIEQDVEVVRIDQRVLGRRVEEIRRVTDDELIDGRAAGHEHRRRASRPAACAAGALPGRRNRARISGQHRHIQRADVDPELQGIGGNDSPNEPLAKASLDLTTTVRQIAAAIAADDIRGTRRPVERILQVCRQDFHRKATLREEDQLQVVLEELERDPSRFREIRTANPEFRVDDRRVDEEKELLTARGAAPLHERETPAGQTLRELSRVRDRRRGADEDRIRAIVPADALEPPEDVREMAPKHATIRVQLVDDDEPEILEQLGPARMVRKDS